MEDQNNIIPEMNTNSEITESAHSREEKKYRDIENSLSDMMGDDISDTPAKNNVSETTSHENNLENNINENERHNSFESNYTGRQDASEAVQAPLEEATNEDENPIREDTDSIQNEDTNPDADMVEENLPPDDDSNQQGPRTPGSLPNDSKEDTTEHLSNKMDVSSDKDEESVEKGESNVESIEADDTDKPSEQNIDMNSPMSAKNDTELDETTEMETDLVEKHTEKEAEATATDTTEKDLEKDSEAADRDPETVETDAESAEKDSETAEKDSETAEKDSETAEKDSETAEKDSETAEKDSGTAEKDSEMVEKDTEMVEKDTEMEKDPETSEKDKEGSEKDSESSEQQKVETNKEKESSEEKETGSSVNAFDSLKSVESSSTEKPAKKAFDPYERSSSRQNDKGPDLGGEDTSDSFRSDKDKAVDSPMSTDGRDDSGTDNTVFVQVNSEDKDGENDKDDTTGDLGMEHDPIASDTFENLHEENREGADEELCIIPDSERVITQEEKDAASALPKLKDIADSSVVTDSVASSAAKESEIEILVSRYEKDDLQICNICQLQRKVQYTYRKALDDCYLCDDNCLDQFKNNEKVTCDDSPPVRVKVFEKESVALERTCSACKKKTSDIENNLTWEIMDFCNEFCLTKYQKDTGSNCSSCKGEVKSNSLGKYCVRFGNDIRQFCTSSCLEEYKKGLKVCSYCQQDMSRGPEGFLAPVGDKGHFKDFCSQICMEKYDVMTNNRPPKVEPGTTCSVCKTSEKQITIEYEMDGQKNYFCNEPCFVAFSFVNNITSGKCAMCRRHFSKRVLEEHAMYYDNVQYSFCSNSCQNIYIIAHRKIVPCSWCKVKKYNFDMIRRYSKAGPQINMCSVNCLSLYSVSLNAVSAKKSSCNYCQKLLTPMYHLTMSDATIRNFCSYNCVMYFQNQFPKQPITINSNNFPVPTGAPKKNKKQPDNVIPLPVITNVQSLATSNSPTPNGTSVGPPALQPISTTRATRSKVTPASQAREQQAQQAQQAAAAAALVNNFSNIEQIIQVKRQIVVKQAMLPEQRNCATMCKVRTANKGLQNTPEMVDKEMQTDKVEPDRILIPVPIPIYVPAPMHMWTAPAPMPVPFPIPIPIPIFIPTTRNSAAGIMKEIKKIQVKMPTDPYEAELLMMAEMVADEKKEDPTDSESDVDDTGGADDGSFSPEPVDASNTFGDDMLQMALKMATELDEPAVDLEGALTANTITAQQAAEQQQEESDDQPMHHHMMERQSMRGRKRGMRTPKPSGAKRGRRMSQHHVDMPMLHVNQPTPPAEPVEKPDANMCLKYTFGVNAWKQWVTTKNAELEKSSRRLKLFKTEILQLTSDELNYSLCLFVKEVRKPNGAEYAPDTIYYLCLGIQQYLFENGRIDNIFCDPYYEKFTDCLDEVAKKFSVLYNDSHYIVTRVEEEHLWESKQLGAHSPHVLLSTLMFFNTKHFNLTTVDEHMQLSFSHIMKHWKRNPNQPVASKVPSSRNVLLRFYPPQSAIQNNAKKKKVYEQQQNEDNPLRCPVKLYEFYLSKCPESVKTRNDVFYLQPERSCVPDSPVWYSTMPLPRDALEKMLHRVKMVKEINVALLTS